MRFILVMGLALVAGCDEASLNLLGDVLAEELATAGEAAGDGATAGSSLACVVNQSGVAITYRIGVLGIEPVAEALAVGASACFDTPCGVGMGIDQIVAGTAQNPAGAQFAAEQIPCDGVLELHVQPDASVAAFLQTETASP